MMNTEILELLKSSDDNECELRTQALDMENLVTHIPLFNTVRDKKNEVVSNLITLYAEDESYKADIVADWLEDDPEGDRDFYLREAREDLVDEEEVPGYAYKLRIEAEAEAELNYGLMLEILRELIDSGITTLTVRQLSDVEDVANRATGVTTFEGVMSKVNKILKGE